MQKAAIVGGPLAFNRSLDSFELYSVDSISKPQASRRSSGMYFEFLLRRAHSRRRVDRRYWSGESLYSRTTCSNSVIVGVIGPMGSGLPQFGFPRRFAMDYCLSTRGNMNCKTLPNYKILRCGWRILGKHLMRTRMSTIHQKATKLVRSLIS